MEDPQNPRSSALNRIKEEMALKELDRTMRFARLRCLSRCEIIRLVCDPTEMEHLTDHIGRLKEFILTEPEVKSLVAGMERLARHSEASPTKLKSKVDRTLLRLVRILPSDLANSFAEPYVNHPRKARRKWAYSALREKQISDTIATKLADAFRRTGDQETLELIARNPERVAGVGATFLLSNVVDRYWRARILEALLVNDRSSALALSRQYPFEFAHAVGRTGDASLLDALRSIFEVSSNNLEFLSIYAYALGKIGARDELESLEHFIGEKWSR